MLQNTTFILFEYIKILFIPLVTLNDLSEISLVVWCSRNIYYYYRVSVSCAALYFLGNHDTF